jgi:hypothetical protein
VASKKQIVLIPYWVQEIMQRNKLPLSDCLDLAKLRPLISLNDLLMFAVMDNCQEEIIGSLPGQDTVPSYFQSIIWEWSKIIPTNEHELNDFCWKSISTISKDVSILNELKERLFCEDAKSSMYEKPFITYDLTPGITGVVIFPGFFTSARKKEFQKPLVEAILKLSYVYDSTHEVAKTPLFKRYLELLAA